MQLSMDHMAEASKTEKEQFLALIPQLMHAAKDEVRRGSLGLWGGSSSTLVVVFVRPTNHVLSADNNKLGLGAS